MLESNIKEQLQKAVCYRCGSSLESAKVETIAQAATAFVAHTVCSNCNAEGMVTITSGGIGILPLITDLTFEEHKKFNGAGSVGYEDLFELHRLLKRKNIWNLLEKKEQSLEKETKK